MKKILLTLFLLPFITKAQETVSNYTCSLTKKVYNVQADEPDKKGNISFYIDCESRDKLIKKTCIVLNKKDVDNFVNCLRIQKENYIKWSNIADSNNVSDLSKDIFIDPNIIWSAFYFGSSWQYDYSVSVTGKFDISNGSKKILIFGEQMTSTSNQFMKCDGFLLILSSVEDIDGLINALNKENVIQFYKNKKAKDNLFSK